MQIDFPFRIDETGRTARTDADDHLRDMVEQVLFTAPGERVDRPDFGCGLLRLVFGPNSPELAATVEFTVRAALQRWLGDVLAVQTLTVTSDDATLRVEATYVNLATGAPGSATFTREVTP
ncbi:GPW/gp25 family protein [Tessaracoccus sp. HDW20]|uniref:GPW/gp25 family protein n=1 Tax=Tessaracoccus coleopterorum TaxID=2714950 RepID=UPI0018D49575|nr:GPW/gp25 family protein [Tessaracoccus coleopterorum]NHB84429.1 GPW/gp25 family protein [Tessaracoccus coleopterorum]